MNGEVAWSDGPDYIEVSEAYLFPLDPCQREEVDAMASKRANGRPSYTKFVLHKPRQNGKTADIVSYELPALALDGMWILHTAHEVKTAQKTFRQLAKCFEDNPDLAAMVDRISRTNGKEGIYLKNGGFVEYSARSKSAGRGNTYDVLVLDEDQELTEDQLAALLPVVSASPHDMSQVIYLGTPPGPRLEGTVPRKQRKSAMEGAPSTCLFEWSVDKCPPPDATFDDVLPLVAETNPALGSRIDVETVETEFNSMDIDTFARERLGWWSETGGAADPKVGKALWDACAVPLPPHDGGGRKAFGVKFDPDGNVALCGCRFPREGDGWTPHVELVAVGPMDEMLPWVSDFLCDAARAETTAVVAVDGKRGKDVLIPKLKGAYPKQALVDCTTAGYMAAVSMFHDAVSHGEVTHPRAPDGNPLDEAAATCPERAIGKDGGWGFGGDAVTIDAAAIAYWAAATTRRDPEDEGEVFV